MAYTTPRTWATGETPTATQLNTHLRDNIAYLYQADDAWTTITIAGYQTLSGTRAAAYRIINGNVVQLRGTLQKTTGTFTSGSNSLTTISAIAPPALLQLPIATNDTYLVTQMQVTIAGLLRVSISGTTATWISLEGLTYTVYTTTTE